MASAAAAEGSAVAAWVGSIAVRAASSEEAVPVAWREVLQQLVRLRFGPGLADRHRCGSRGPAAAHRPVDREGGASGPTVVITKVVHGWRPAGLIRYLMGPGRAQEHTNPRVIAAWDGRDVAWQPAGGADGRFVLGPLITALEAPAIAAGLPTTISGSGKRGYVWHCSARVAVGDRSLTDGEWA